MTDVGQLEPLYLAKYIDRMETGTRDMIIRCREAGLPEPEYAVSDGFMTTLRRRPRQESVAPTMEVTGEVTGEVVSRPESRPESQPESRPESMELRVLSALEAGPLSKAEISAQLGHKEVSGRLNQVIRLLLADQTVEYTIPDKPVSRMQRYQLTDKGKAHLATSRRGEAAP